VGKQCGFNVEIEPMRIPSTKNISHLGRSRWTDPTNPEQASQIESNRKALLKNFTGEFTVRKTPQERNEEFKQKQLKKKQKLEQRAKEQTNTDEGKQEVMEEETEEVHDNDD
jgi:hypothetical protein